MLPIHDHKGKTVGVFIADVSLNWLKEQIDEIDEKNNDRRKEILSYFKKPFDSYSFIIGRNGDYIVHPDRKRILNENFFAYANATPTPLDEELGKDMLAGKNGKKLIDIEKTVSYVFYSPLKRTGWSMGIVVPKAAVLQPGFVLGAIILAVMGLGLLAIFLVCRFTIHFATKPLTYLSDSANEVAKGNFEIETLEIRSSDEIGVVTKAFNKMVASIREYIEQIKENMEHERKMQEKELRIEATLKEAQLKYLQTQINPHFLFNTLNAGAQLAMMEEAERTYDYIQNTAEFFRYNVREGNTTVKLADEISLIDHYIYILNVRFSGDIKYEKDIDESLTEILMPSMILQPIVENSINHGIKEMEGKGRITLRVYSEDDNVCISVRDNGIGMTQEMIDKVLSGELTEEEKAAPVGAHGIGMDNVIKRLRLFTDREDSVSIKSEGEGKGTEVIIKLTNGGSENV